MRDPGGARGPDLPVFSIGVAAELLGVHPRTLRLYESHGLVKPRRRGNKRFYSENDLTWIRCVRDLIHEKGISIEGIRRLLAVQRCWEIKGCSEDVRRQCLASRESQEPCWVLASRACPRWLDSCSACEVFEAAREPRASSPRSGAKKALDGRRRLR